MIVYTKTVGRNTYESQVVQAAFTAASGAEVIIGCEGDEDYDRFVRLVRQVIDEWFFPQPPDDLFIKRVVK